MRDNEVFRKKIELKGKANLVSVSAEECCELSKELLKFLRSKGDIQHLAEEVADVEICIEQLRMIFPKLNTLTPMYRKFKIDRLRLVYLEENDK
jgi:hypothetical protein